MNPFALAISFISWLAMAGIGSAIALTWRGQDLIGLQFNRPLLLVNYFNSGFPKRALTGTIALLFGTDLPGVVYFHIASALWLATPLAVILYMAASRIDLRSRVMLTALLVLSPHLFMSWAPDLGRVDMLTLGMVSWAAVATIAGKPALGAAAVAVGALCHETAIVFGVPLLLAISFQSGKWQSVARLAVPTTAILAVIGIAQVLFAPSPARLIEVMSAAPESQMRDIAIYSYIWNTIPAAICVNLSNGHYFQSVAIGLALLLLLIVTHGCKDRSTLALYAVAVLTPFVVASIVAVDVGRWLSMSALNVWLLMAARIALTRAAPWHSFQHLLFCILAAAVTWSAGPTEPLHPSPKLSRLGSIIGAVPPWPPNQDNASCIDQDAFRSIRSAIR